MGSWGKTKLVLTDRNYSYTRIQIYHFMKICLIRPSTLTTSSSLGEDSAAPIGIAYLAACLIDVGNHVTVVDGLGEALGQYISVPVPANGLRHGLSNSEIISRIPVDIDLSFLNSGH